MTTLLLILFVVVVVIGGAVGAIALNQKRSFKKANELVPGQATAAPAHWAGSHSPEAKLHRRLTGALAALRSNPTLSDAAFMDSRASMQEAAVRMDERLIAAAGLPASHRAQAIAAVETQVTGLEDAIAGLVLSTSGVEDQQALANSVRAAQIRLDALASARTELDQLTAAAMVEQPEAQLRPAEEPRQQSMPQTSPPEQPRPPENPTP